MLSKNSSKPDVRASFIKYINKCAQNYDAICLAESSSQAIGINDLLPKYQLYSSELANTRLYQHGFKFAIAHSIDCHVQSLNCQIDEFPDQEFINLNENKGYCSEQLFSITHGNAEVVAVHIQAIDSRNEMKDLSRYSQNAGLKRLCTYICDVKPDIVIGDFNLNQKSLTKKLRDFGFDIDDSDYSFVDCGGNDVSGSSIHHAISRNKDAYIKYICDVQTHLTTAMHVEIQGGDYRHTHYEINKS